MDSCLYPILFLLTLAGVRFVDPVQTWGSKHAPAANSLTEQVADNPHEESYFYSAAIINGFYIIMPCQRSVRGRRRTIGLLLQFPGGRQSSVGQIRLDCLGSLLQIGSHQSFWLGFSKDDHRSFMSILELSEPKLNVGLSTFEVQLSGMLEWWCSLRQCQVCYMGISPPTRLRLRGGASDRGSFPD